MNVTGWGRRDLVWFIVMPLAVAGLALCIQLAVRHYRTQHLWSQPAPPPAQR